MTLKLSAIAQEKVIEKTKEHNGEAIWVNPIVTCYWNCKTEELTSLLLPEERKFNEVEQAIITYYENQIKIIKQNNHNFEKYMVENAKFRVLGAAILTEYYFKGLEELVYRIDSEYDGPTGPDALKEAKSILQKKKENS